VAEWMNTVKKKYCETWNISKCTIFRSVCIVSKIVEGLKRVERSSWTLQDNNGIDFV